jgi:intracellular multiplication protein IcmG
MVDKNTSPDDEYQFPQEEYVSPEHTSEQHAVEHDASTVDKKIEGGPASFLSEAVSFLQRKKRVVMVVTVVVLGYFFIHFGAGQKQSIPVTDTQPDKPVPVMQSSSDDAAMMGSLSSLQAHSSQTRSDIQNLQTQLSDLQNAFSQAQSDNQQLRSTLGALTEQVKSLSEQLNKLIAQGAPKKTGRQLYFHLRAVVPDRAWIASGSGETRTVTVGDRIQSYGKVVAIYPQQGIVQTSSGRKIEYGPNDR